MRWIAMCLACLSVHDSPAGEKVFPVRSCFAASMPAVRPGQVLIQTHLYLSCVDVAAKQPVWIAYHVSRSDWDTENVLERNFSTPPDLRGICLEQADFAGSGYDLGHLYGLQHVSANRYAAEVNQLQAIAAQSPGLNRGPWLEAENLVHRMSQSGPVAVLAGQLFESAMPGLPRADEPHKVASHCWMLIKQGDTEASWVIPQDAKLEDRLNRFSVHPDGLRVRVSSEWWKGGT